MLTIFNNWSITKLSNFFSFTSSKKTPSNPRFISKITPIQPQLSPQEKLDNQQKLDKINKILKGLPALRITTTTKDNTRNIVNTKTYFNMQLCTL